MDARARVKRACSYAKFLQVAYLTGSLFLTVTRWRKVDCFRFVSLWYEAIFTTAEMDTSRCERLHVMCSVRLAIKLQTVTLLLMTLLFVNY